MIGFVSMAASMSMMSVTAKLKNGGTKKVFKLLKTNSQLVADSVTPHL